MSSLSGNRCLQMLTLHQTNDISNPHFVKITTATVLTLVSGVVLQWRNRLARRTYKQYLPSKRCGGCEFEPHLEHAFSWRNTQISTHACYTRHYSSQQTWGFEPKPSIHFCSLKCRYRAGIEPSPIWLVWSVCMYTDVTDTHGPTSASQYTP